MLDDQFHVYDTTLRDGAQQEGLNLSVADKLVIARHLDRLGVGFIEGGWPGAIPKDTEFFRRAQTELSLGNATLAAFGSTRKAGVKAADDAQVAALRESRAPVVTLVATCGPRASGSSSTPSTSSTATGPTRPTRWSACAPPPRRAPT
jgi:2-isopropylmalate synthase